MVTTQVGPLKVLVLRPKAAVLSRTSPQPLPTFPVTRPVLKISLRDLDLGLLLKVGLLCDCCLQQAE